MHYPTTMKNVSEGRTIVQRIWSSPEAILLIFAGSAAEFALNRALDWLFYTNELPAAPLQRFFKTVKFAQTIAFSDDATVARVLGLVNHAHRSVEQARGTDIPQWAYRDVLFMLIDYGERAHAFVFQPMTKKEQEAYYMEVIKIGNGLNIDELPATYDDYQRQRVAHLHNDMAVTPLTKQLYQSYELAIGSWRMRGLLSLQACLCPTYVKQLLRLERRYIVCWLLQMYRHLPGGRKKLQWLYPLLLPPPYNRQLSELGRP
ncbi:MAG: hypothetical protein NVS4B8_00080 [Herpetosiphon sp.]